MKHKTYAAALMQVQAAGPELLAALRLFVDAASEYAAENGEWRADGPMSKALAAGRALINKVEGR